MWPEVGSDDPGPRLPVAGDARSRELDRIYGAPTSVERQVLLSPPGWYPDPGGNAQIERYWDGAVWTDHYRP